MKKYHLSIIGRREYDLDFLIEFLDEQIKLLKKIPALHKDVEIMGSVKHIVIQKQRFDKSVDELLKWRN